MLCDSVSFLGRCLVSKNYKTAVRDIVIDNRLGFSAKAFCRLFNYVTISVRRVAILIAQWIVISAACNSHVCISIMHRHTHTHLTAFFWDYPGELVPER